MSSIEVRLDVVFAIISGFSASHQGALMAEEHSHNYVLPPHSFLAKASPLEKVREQLFYSRRLERLWIFIEESYSDLN